MFGSLILPTGTGTGTGVTRIRTGGGHQRSPRDNLSAMGSTPYHPTMYFPSRKLPRTKIRASFTAPETTLPRVQLSKPNTLNLYQILRIKHNASSLEIKSAYRKLAKQFHPDALPPTPTTTSSEEEESSDDDAAGRDFMAIHNAYATLSDPTERARYDLSIQIQIQISSHTKFHSYSSSAVDGNENRSYGMQTRRWETDQCW